MLSDTLIAGILLVYLLAFFSINAHNVMRGLRARRKVRVYAELERPKGVSINLAALGTIIFFVECVLFVFLGLSGLDPYLHVPPLQLRFPCDSFVQVAGLTVMGAGFFVFIWSVVVRGRHSVSWEMPEDQRLVSRGPYRYVRHPSYLGYFLMFAGLLLSWLNLVAIFPLFAIPGYVRITFTEEELLIQRFGDEYKRYQEVSGRFIPRRTVKKRS